MSTSQMEAINAPRPGVPARLSSLRSAELATVLLGRGLTVAIGYGLLRAYTTICGPSDFGFLTVWFASVSLGTTFLYAPLANLCNLHYHRLGEPEKRAQALNGALGIGLAPLASVPILLALTPQFTVLWVLGAMMLFANGTFGMLNGLFNIARRRLLFAACSAGDYVARIVVLLVWFHLSGRMSVTDLAAANVIAVAFILGLVAAVWRKNFPPSRGWPHLATYRASLPFVVLAFCGWGLAVADRYMLMALAGPAESGRYAALYQVCSAVPLFAIGVVAPLFQPVVFERHGRSLGVGGTLTAALSLAALVMTPVLWTICWLPDVVSRLVIARGFAEPRPEVITLVAAGTYFLGLEALGNIPLLLENRLWMLCRISFLALALDVIVNLAFIQRFGMLASAAGTALAYALEGGLVLRTASRLAGYIVPWRAITLGLAVALGGGAVNALLPSLPALARIVVLTALLAAWFVWQWAELDYWGDRLRRMIRVSLHGEG